MEIEKSTVVAIIVIFFTLILGAMLIINRKGINLPFLPKANGPIEVELKSAEKNFYLDYAALPDDYILRLASFEPNEGWQPEVQFSGTINWEGENALVLDSRDGVKKENYLYKNLDLSNHQIFKTAVYLLSDPADLDSAEIYFSDKSKTSLYSYPLTNLVRGWNFLRIQKIKFSTNNFADKVASPGAKQKAVTVFGWDKIERIGVAVTSRANSAATIYFDDLVGLQGEDYLNDWLTAGPGFLNVTKISEGTVLKASNYAGSVAIIKKLSGISDFVFKAKIMSLKDNARSGLFVRGDYKKATGYYFLIDGVGGDRWQVLRIGSDNNSSPGTAILKNGTLNNFKMDMGQPLWMKIEGRGQILRYFLSKDGKEFTLLSEIKDAGIAQGGLGIAVLDQGVTAFNNFEFQK